MKILFCVAALALSLSTLAAVPKKAFSVENALKLSPEERISLLRKIGPNSYRDLHVIAFDQSRPYSMRWRAVVSMAWLGGREAVIDLEKALDDKDWFMRDAGLKGLAKIDKVKAMTWAKKLLDDPALVVRSAAVQTLHDLNDVSAESLLWEKLDAPENFRGEQSLFIRRQILSALVDLSTSKGTAVKFAKFLTDKDKSLHLVAVEGIERSTGVRNDEDPRRSLQILRNQYAKNLVK